MRRPDLPASAAAASFLLTAALLLLPSPSVAQQDGDRSSPGAVSRALYDVISGGADEARDWERFRSLFLGGARIVAVRFDEQGRSQGRDLSVDEFVERAGAFYREDGFWEEEIRARVDRYGTVAHVWSTYATWIGSPEGEPDDRGINSIQMVETGDGWAITAIAYYSEAAGETVPGAYLPDGG
jgi:hypothetical protein